MTNKTIDGVPRKLLERVAGIANKSYDIEDAMLAGSELRALLAAPVVERQEPAGWRDPSALWSTIQAANKARLEARGHDLKEFSDPLFTTPPAPHAVDQLLREAYEHGYNDGQNNPNGYGDKADRDKCVADLLDGVATQPTDPDRLLKDALFACIEAGGADRNYGGVLTTGDRHAWVRFTTTDANAPAAEQPEPVGEVTDMKYNAVKFYRATGDTSKPYLLPGTKLYTTPPVPLVAVVSHWEDWSCVNLRINGRLRMYVESCQPEQTAPAALAIPDECPHLIVFDDTDREQLMFAGTGARSSALKAWEQISTSWNAHLFVRVERNSRDDRFPSATTKPGADHD